MCIIKEAERFIVAIQQSNGFGGLLRKRRLQRNLTQPQLAELSDLSQRYISQLEHHHEPGFLPPLPTFERLAEVLDISRSELLRAAGYLEAEGPAGRIAVPPEVDPAEAEYFLRAYQRLPPLLKLFIKHTFELAIRASDMNDEALRRALEERAEPGLGRVRGRG